MSSTLTIFLLISWPTWPPSKCERQRTHMSLNYVIFPKNELTCLKNRYTTTRKVITSPINGLFRTIKCSPKVRSRSTAPKRTMMLLHAKRRGSATALMWRYVGKNTVDLATKGGRSRQKKRLKNFRVTSRQRRHDYKGNEWSSHSQPFSDNAKRALRLQNGYRAN